MNERKLIQLCLQGEEHAFEALMRPYQTKIYHYCLGKVKDEEIAQDLTQDTFIHAFQHLASFRQKASFYTWTWKIAHNLTLNYLKKHRRIIEESLREEKLTFKKTQKEEVDEELIIRIQLGMKTLPQKQRLIFEMYDLQGMPQKQIAAELNIAHGTVRSRLYYARKKIRRFLQDFEHESPDEKNNT